MQRNYAVGHIFPSERVDSARRGFTWRRSASRNIVAHLGMKQANSSLTKGGSDLADLNR